MSSTLGYLSVNDAAAQLGIKPRDVDRLVETNQLRGVILVDPVSLSEYKAGQ